jgi:hypothetical protein
MCVCVTCMCRVLEIMVSRASHITVRDFGHVNGAAIVTRRGSPT